MKNMNWKKIIFILLVFVFAGIIIYKIMEFIKAFGVVMDINKEISEQQDYYESVTVDELKKMDDEELYEAVFYRLYGRIDYDRYDESIAGFNRQQQKFWLLDQFDAELQNGGLCQYLCNTEGKYAETVYDLLTEFDLVELADLYKGFFEDNNLSWNHFESVDAYDYEELLQMFSFDAFDEAFYEQYNETPIYDVLTEYVRQNIEYFQ